LNAGRKGVDEGPGGFGVGGGVDAPGAALTPAVVLAVPLLPILLPPCLADLGLPIGERFLEKSTLPFSQTLAAEELLDPDGAIDEGLPILRVEGL
jgi:hypothetical protein